MTTCLVTDRRRLCGAGCPIAEARARLVEQARRAAAADVDLIQVREPDLEAGALAEIVRAVLAATAGSSTRVVVNDRLDVALACGAHGVHLRGDSFSPADVRRIAPRPFLVGRSVHSAAEVDAGVDVDYFIAGTAFPTASKPGMRSLLGVHGLRAIVRASRTPVLAIGGITLERLGDVADAGAAGVAGIGLFVDLDAIAAVQETIRSLFDSAKSGSYH
jgi:thiamine-phosphate pyrophosphorylase